MAAGNLPNQTLVEELTDHLSCSICMEEFKEPKSLPCLHNFCKLCLIGYIKSKGFQDSFPCPICQQKTELHTDDINEMTTNFFIMNILNVIGINVSDKHCDFCLSHSEGKKAVATCRCLQCGDFLCLDCSSFHTKTKLTYNHQVIPLADLANIDVQTALRSSQEIRCPIHPEEPVKYYCQQDKVPVCRDCIVLNHRSHICEGLKEAADDYKKILQAQIISLQCSVDKYQDNIQTIDRRETANSEINITVRQDIKSWAINTIKKVEEHEKNLLEELDAKANLENKTTLIVRDENELKLGTLQSTLETAKQVMKYGKDAEILFLQSQMTERMNQIEKEPILPPFKFRNNITLQISKDIVGTKLITEEIRQGPITLLDDIELIRSFDITISDKCNLNQMFTVAILPNSDIAITDEENWKVKLFDKQGTLKWERSTDAKPWNIGIMPDGSIMVSKKNSPNIDIFTSTGNTDRSTCIPTNVNCNFPGLAIDKNKLIQTDTEQKCFYICDLDGTVKSTVHNAQFIRPHCVACSNNGNIIITDYDSHCAFLYSPTGELLVTYGTPGTRGNKPGKLNCPRGVCTDHSNNILITDCSNKKVHLLTPEAKFIKYVCTPEDLEHKNSRALVITPQGYLVVTLDVGHVKIFKYTTD